MKTKLAQPPPAVPDHELLACVGRGSYGEVWLARTLTGTFRGVKVIRRDTFDQERPFEREFAGIRNYEPVSRTHPGLVAVLHVGRGEGYFYCVMEIADDQQTGSQVHPSQYAPRTLASDLARCGRLPVRECVELGLELSAALDHLHQEGLVHRDIKPSNIIFVRGRPKLADIGLVTGIGTTATQVGTAGYIAPEGPGSPAADLYSLGKVLYEISMGKDREEFPELPTQLREMPDAPALIQLNSVILRACASDPGRRYASAAAMHQALAQLAGVLAEPPGLRAARPAAPAATRAPAAVILAPSADSQALDLARNLADTLQARGLDAIVFAPEQPSLGWARELEQRIADAGLVVAVHSLTTPPDRLQAYGIELTRQHIEQRKTGPRFAVIHFKPGTHPGGSHGHEAQASSANDAPDRATEPGDGERHSDPLPRLWRLVAKDTPRFEAGHADDLEKLAEQLRALLPTT